MICNIRAFLAKMISKRDSSEFILDGKLKKRGTISRCPFHIRRPSHCPELLNDATRSPRRYEYSPPYRNMQANMIIPTYNLIGGAYKHIPRTFIIAKFRQFLKVAKFPDVKNKAPYERLIKMS